MKTYGKDIKNKVLHLYKEERMSVAVIAARLNIGKTTVRRWLKEEGLLKCRSEARRHKFTLNESYFSIIDNEEKAYFLGLFYADGNISINKGNYLIRLTSKDKDILEKFAISLGSNRKIYTEIHNKFEKVCYKVVLTSKQMYEDLDKMGCTPRKSLTLEFPTCIPDHLIHHFIRGYFDGDGTVGIYDTGTKWKRLISGFCGTKNMLDVISNYISVSKNPRKQKNIYTLTLSVKDSIDLYNYMYKDSTVSLIRKKDIFEHYVKQRSSTTTIRHPKK